MANPALVRSCVPVFLMTLLLCVAGGGERMQRAADVAGRSNHMAWLGRGKCRATRGSDTNKRVKSYRLFLASSEHACLHTCLGDRLCNAAEWIKIKTLRATPPIAPGAGLTTNLECPGGPTKQFHNQVVNAQGHVGDEMVALISVIKAVRLHQCAALCLASADCGGYSFKSVKALADRQCNLYTDSGVAGQLDTAHRWFTSVRASDCQPLAQGPTSPAVTTAQAHPNCHLLRSPVVTHGHFGKGEGQNSTQRRKRGAHCFGKRRAPSSPQMTNDALVDTLPADANHDARATIATSASGGATPSVAALAGTAKVLNTPATVDITTRIIATTATTTNATNNTTTAASPTTTATKTTTTTTTTTIMPLLYQPEPCVVDQFTDYFGHDLPSGKFQAAGVKQCISQCQLRHECTYFTFNWGFCFLKASSAGRIPSQTGTSGSCAKPVGVELAQLEFDCTLETGFDYYGNDLINGGVPAESTSDCTALCRQRVDCSAFTFAWGTCWLKSAHIGRIAQPFSTGGRCSYTFVTTTTTNMITTSTSTTTTATTTTTTTTTVTSTTMKTTTVTTTTVTSSTSSQTSSSTATVSSTSSSTHILPPPTTTTTTTIPTTTTTTTVSSTSTSSSLFVYGDPWCFEEQGIVMQGNDLIHGGFEAVSSRQCETHCIQIADCTHYTYISSEGLCFLKDRSAPRTFVPLDTSGTCVKTYTSAASCKKVVTTVTTKVIVSALNEDATWETYTTAPIELGEVATALVNDHIYLVGEGSKATLRYSLENKSWVSLPTRPFVGSHHAAVAFGNKVLLFGGFVGGFKGMRGVQAFDVDSLKWATLAPIPYGTVGSASGVLIEGQVYVCGGLDTTRWESTPKCAKYNPMENKWAGIANMLVGVNHHAAGTDGTNMYIFGGRTNQKNLPSNGIASVQVYNPHTNTWQNGPEMVFGRSGMGAAPFLSGLFYIFGGEETQHTVSNRNSKTFKQVHTFKPATGIWGVAPNMPLPVHGCYPISDIARQRIYVVGGGPSIGRSMTGYFQVLHVPGVASKIQATTTSIEHLACAVLRTPVANTELVCQEDSVISEVQFAKLGRPIGSCGGYTSMAKCSVDLALAVKMACVGKKSCVLRAEQYGAVCAGANTLAVQVKCTSVGGKAEVAGSSTNMFEKVGQGCCRTASAGTGSYTKAKAKTLQVCEGKCLKSTRCVGIEYDDTNINSCELHLEAVTKISVSSVCSKNVCLSRTAHAKDPEPTLKLQQCGYHHAPVLESLLPLQQL